MALTHLKEFLIKFFSSWLLLWPKGHSLKYFFQWCLMSPFRWMEACLDEEMPPTTELEERLRNGVHLAKLANFFAPKMVSEKRIYDRDQCRYKVNLPRPFDYLDHIFADCIPCEELCFQTCQAFPDCF